MQLKDLAGEHVLTGVDRWTKHDKYEVSDCLSFCLDGTVYTAVEDASDGYRSHMSELVVTTDRTLNNTFAPHRVIASYSDNTYEDILSLIDVTSGKVILRVGTDFSDSYYPCFIAEYDPTSLAINQQQ